MNMKNLVIMIIGSSVDRRVYCIQRLIRHITVAVLLIHSAHSDTIGEKDNTCMYSDNEFDFQTCTDVAATYYCFVNENTQNWFQELYNKTINGNNGHRRIRREIRTLSAHERHVFFRAINDLKNDKSIEPNMYDAFAAAHFNLTFCSAHKGSNFFGWHRIYILLFEAALRDKESSVVLPYWASSIDSNPITDPKESIIFSDHFVGNGDGYVTTGPFGGWTNRFGCPLERNIGNNGTEILSADVIELIENDDNLIDYANITDAGIVGVNRTTTIEQQHNLLHNWIGGMMKVLDTASNDPIFFLHHAYIDYIWEKFREKQKRLGINTTDIYPGYGNNNYTLQRFHAANRTMNCFTWLANKDGYSEMYTGSIYTYAPLPSCPSCGSEFLKCNATINRCIPVQDAKTDSSTSQATNLS